MHRGNQSLGTSNIGSQPKMAGDEGKKRARIELYLSGCIIKCIKYDIRDVFQPVCVCVCVWVRMNIAWLHLFVLFFECFKTNESERKHNFFPVNTACTVHTNTHVGTRLVLGLKKLNTTYTQKPSTSVVYHLFFAFIIIPSFTLPPAAATTYFVFQFF